MLDRLKALASSFGGKAPTTGEAGEKAAEQHLVSTRGVQVLARNWRHGRDELDLVCRDGEILVFVEVKTRRAGARVPGYFSVNKRKKKALLRAIRAYRARVSPKPGPFGSTLWRSNGPRELPERCGTSKTSLFSPKDLPGARDRRRLRPLVQFNDLRLMADMDQNRHPFLDGLSKHRGSPPTVIVIFGASGDLTARKLVPAIYNLGYDKLLPADFRLIGFGRQEITDDDFRAMARDAVKEFSRRELNEDIWDKVEQSTFYRPEGTTMPPPSIDSSPDRGHGEGTGSGTAEPVLHLDASVGLRADPPESRSLRAGRAPPRNATDVEGRHREALWARP